MTAKTIVAFDKKSEVLLAPNIVVTPVPAIGPTKPLPFDDCKRTATDIKMQTSTKNIISIVIIIIKDITKLRFFQAIIA